MKGFGEKGGGFKYSVESFFLTVPNVFVVESFTVALISVIEKVWIRRRGVSMFSIKSFCLTVAKVSIGESFTVALSSCSEKVWIRGGGGGSIKIFRRIFFVSQCRNIR